MGNSAWPKPLSYLKDHAERCAEVGSPMEAVRFIDGLAPPERQQLEDLYRRMVERGDKSRIDAWLGRHVTTETDQMLRLLVVLDTMADRGLIPGDVPKVRFINWDERDVDDDGNQW